MNINERERKLLLALAVVMTIFLIAYLIVPEYKKILQLKTDIENESIVIAQSTTEEITLNQDYAEKQKTLNELTSEEDDAENRTIEHNFYKEITDGQIVVEINKFIPVSAGDKFVIEEITFLDNLPDDTTATGTESSTNTSTSNTGGITERNDSIEATATEANNAVATNTSGEIPTVQNIDNTNSTSNQNSTSDTNNTNSTDSNTTDLNVQNTEDYDAILAEYGLEKNLTKVVFEGYYGSLIKFADASNNNENYVAILSIDIKNIALDDPSLQNNIIRGEMIMAFPTYSGSEDVSDLYALIDDMYVTSNKDPFKPYDGFVIVDDNFIDNSGNNSGNNGVISGGNGSGSDEVVYKVIEHFNKNSYFFVTNDTRNGGYVSTSQKSTDGNASLKLYYDFYNRNNKNIAYAVNQNETVKIAMTPEQILVDVFNDSSNENQFGVVFRDATGADIEAATQNLDFNGWATCTVPLPDNVVYPLVIQRFYVRSGGTGVKQEGTILIDNLRIIEY